MFSEYCIDAEKTVVPPMAGGNRNAPVYRGNGRGRGRGNGHSHRGRGGNRNRGKRPGTCRDWNRVASIKTTLVDAVIHMFVKYVMVIIRDRNALREQK